MPAPNVRNAVFGHLQGIRPAGPRLRAESYTGPACDFDFLAVVARSPAELATIRAAQHRRFRTKPNTISRRRDVMARADQVARMLGWEWTDEELELLTEFVGDLVGVESSSNQPGCGAAATPACGASPGPWRRFSRWRTRATTVRPGRCRPPPVPLFR